MKNRMKQFCLPLLVIFSELYIYYQMIIDKPELGNLRKFLFLFIAIIINIVSLIVYKIIKKNISIEKKYLIFASAFGILYVFIVPILMGTDELGHFYRGYEISAGDFVIKDSSKNETIIEEDLFNLQHVKFADRYSLKAMNYKKTMNLINGTTVPTQYSPVTYIPQAIGFRVAKILRLNATFTFFLVRLFNLAAWISITYFGLKLLPNKKLFAFVLLVSPAVLSLMSTSSGDTLTNAVFFYFFAFILNLITTKRKLLKKDYIIFILLGIVISQFKSIYILVLLLLLLIPNECFKNKKNKYISLLSIIILAGILDITWMKLSAQNNFSENSLPQQQIKFILSNPIKYSYILLNTFISDPYYYFTNMIAGNEMCYGTLRLIPVLIVSYFILLILSFFDDKYICKVKQSGKFLIWIIFLSVLALVSTVMYVSWTAPMTKEIGTNGIWGIQARYFIMFVIPITMTFSNKVKLLKDSNRTINVLLALSCVLAINVLKSFIIS